MSNLRPLSIKQNHQELLNKIPQDSQRIYILNKEGQYLWREVGKIEETDMFILNTQGVPFYTQKRKGATPQVREGDCLQIENLDLEDMLVLLPPSAKRIKVKTAKGGVAYKEFGELESTDKAILDAQGIPLYSNHLLGTTKTVAKVTGKKKGILTGEARSNSNPVDNTLVELTKKDLTSFSLLL